MTGTDINSKPNQLFQMTLFIYISKQCMFIIANVTIECEHVVVLDRQGQTWWWHGLVLPSGKTIFNFILQLYIFLVWTTTKNVFFFFVFFFYILEIFKMVRWYVHCEATVCCLENYFTFHQPAGDIRWKISLSIKQMLSYFPMGNHNISW